MLCYASGYGGSVTVQMTISALVGTSGASLFTFSGPAITHVSPVNSATTVGASISFLGTNFASVDLTPTTSIGLTSGTTSWTSYTTVQVMMAGVGYNHAAYLTLTGQTGCTASVFSFDAPAITQLAQPNAPTSSDNSGATVTLSGTNFGATSATPTAALASRPCSSTAYLSQTALKCLAPQAAAAGASTRHAAVTVSDVIGTVAERFSYNAPIVSMLDALNAATSGGGSVTVIGSNFGMYDLSPTVFFGSTVCTTMGWTSNSGISCNPRPTLSMSFHNVRVLESFGTGGVTFSFDSPVLSSITQNGVRAGSSTLTLKGLNFGSTNNTVTVSIGSTPCSTATWLSSTTLLCDVAAGSGSAYPVTAVVNDVYGTLTNVFTYDAAVVTFAVPYNAATSGMGSITIRATNFGASDPTMTISVGPSQCSSASWLTTTSIKCAPPAGYGQTKAVSVLAAGLGGTKLEIFTYDAAVMTYSNAPTSGGTSLTVPRHAATRHDPTLSDVAVDVRCDCRYQMWPSMPPWPLPASWL